LLNLLAASAVLLCLDYILVINKELSIGQVFNSLQVNVVGLIGFVIGLIDEYFRSQTAISRLIEVIDATPEAVGDTQKPFTKSLVMLTSIAPQLFTTLVESTY